MVNSDLKDWDGTPVGIMGFFECIAEYAAAEELLAAATLWLQQEGRAVRIWGPMNFDIWHGYRFMTAGFDERPFYGEPYNKPYYPEYFQRYGFVVRKHWYSVELAGRRPLEEIIDFGIKRHQDLAEAGYRFESLHTADFPGELLKLHSVLAISYHDFLGYTQSPPKSSRLSIMDCGMPPIPGSSSSLMTTLGFWPDSLGPSSNSLTQRVYLEAKTPCWAGFDFFSGDGAPIGSTFTLSG